MRRNWLILMVIFTFVAACNGPSRKGETEDKILNDFSSNSHMAVNSYKKVWGEYQGNDIPDERFIMAAELMSYDPDNYNAYYNFVISNIKESGGAYRLPALRALRSAHGTESLSILFDAYRSGSASESRTALDIIKIRYDEAEGVAALKSEKDFIEREVSILRNKNGVTKTGLGLLPDRDP